jgi:hypothetical protein
LEKALKIALVAATLRLLVAPFFGHLWDIKTLQETLYYTLKGENVYTLVYSLSRKVSESTGQPLFYEGFAYPPHITLILIPFYTLYLTLGGDPQPIKIGEMVVGVGLLYEPKFYLSKDTFLFMTLIKAPMIIADSIIVYILGRRSLRLATIYALSPYVILITGVWGMFDSLVALSLLASIMLAERGRYMLSGLAYGFSLMKLYPLLALPAFMIGLKRRGLNALTSFTLGFAVSQVPTLAYMILDPQSFTYTVLLFHLLRQPSGLTPLRMLSVAENITLTSIISICHTIIAVAVYLAILAYLARNEVDIMRGSALTLLHFLAFSKVVHEQFYLPLYPLLLQLRIREARLIEAIFTSYTLVNTGLFLIAPTLLFLIDYRLLQLQASIVYGDLGYISMNFIGPLVSSLISTITFIAIVKTIVNIVSQGRNPTGGGKET